MLKQKVEFGLTISFLLIISQTLFAQSSTLERFSSVGFPITDNTKTTLPAPLLMADPGKASKKTDEARAILNKLAEKQGWDRFSKNSPTSPIHVELNFVNSAEGERVGHNVYSAFIVYLPLSTLRDQQLISAMFGSTSEDKEQIGFSSDEVPAAAVLKSVGIDNGDSDKVRFATLRIPLMNRVLIEGTARIEKIENDNSIAIAWQLEERFTFKDLATVSPELSKYANRHRKTERNELGQLVEAEPVSYSGFGGYVCVQATELSDQQLLLESRFAMHEPKEWFAGSNFLRSKFPTALQESAQTFRRKAASQSAAQR